MLEQYNPDVEFDWTRILKGPPEPQPEPAAERNREIARHGPSTQGFRPDASAEALRVEELPLAIAAAAEEEQEGPDIEAEIAPEPASMLTPSAALTRLGPEALLRLRARYAEVMARISERIADPAQQDELKAKAERLNPDTWVTDDEVRDGLDVYEATFEALRSIVGRPRKRHRRGRHSRHHESRENAQPASSLPAEDNGPQSFDESARLADAVEEADTSDREDSGDGT